MRTVLIVLVLLGVAFLGLVAFGVVRQGGEGGGVQATGGAPPTRGGKVDKDALEDWEPPDLTQAMARLFAPLAPRIGLASPIRASANTGFPERRYAPATNGGETDMRIARIERVSGAPMSASYGCREADGRECPEVVCVCAPGLTYDEDLFDGCGDGWRKRRRVGDDQLRCRSGDDAATLVIYREGGAIAFSGLGGEAVVQVRER